MSKFKVGDKVVASERGKMNWARFKKQEDLVFEVVFVKHNGCWGSYVIYNENLKGHKAEGYDFLPPPVERKHNYWCVNNDEIELAVKLTEEDMI